MEPVMVRKMDDLGRVVIPAETRRLFNIHEGDRIAISVEDGAITLRKLVSTCVFCDSTDDLADHMGRGVCRSCREDLAAS